MGGWTPGEYATAAVLGSDGYRANGQRVLTVGESEALEGWIAVESNVELVDAWRKIVRQEQTEAIVDEGADVPGICGG
jgi:hypothetical protein